LAQSGPGLWIQVAPGPELGLRDDAELGSNWTGYRHADPVVRSLSAIARVRLEPGQWYLFATLFHGTPEGPGEAWRLDLIDGLPALALNTPAGPGAIGLGAVRLDTPDGRFETDADVVVGSGRGLSLLGATRASLDQRPLYESGGKPASVDLADIDVSGPVAGLPLAARAQAGAATAPLPELPMLWTAVPQPQNAVLSGNRGLAGSVAGFATVLSEPEPTGRNVFAPEGANSAAGLTDGTWNTTADSVMYEPGQPVTVRIAFRDSAVVRRVAWHQWWAKTSSRNTAYLLARATLQASNDGFTNDVRTVGQVAEPGSHPDWGSPVAFEIATDETAARELRLRLEPQPGSAVYLGEVIVNGRAPPGLESAGAYTFTQVAVARLRPAAPSLVLTTQQGDLLELTPEGALAWSRAFPSRLNDVAAVDVDGDGTDELAIAGQDGRLSLLRADGTALWERQLQHYRVAPYVNLVRVGDVDGDGRPEIIAGGNNWRFHAFSAAGDELWNYEAVHPSRSGAVSDLDGDGKAEVLCGTHYYSMSVLKPDGTRKWAASFGPICFDVATGAFDGDNTRGVVCGSGDGSLYLFDAAGQRRLALATGDEVRTVTTADLDGDGRDEALAGGYSHLVYCVDGKGTLRWRVDLGEPVAFVRPVPTPAGTLVAAMTTEGTVATMDGHGRLAARRRLDGGVTTVTVLDGTLAVGTTRGQVVRLHPRP
jgi:hypothetical protein